MGEATAILNRNFWRQPDTQHQRITKKEMKAILLEGDPVIVKGHLYDIKHKHLGLGVYEIWLERWHAN